jgi:hypothetical protein
MRSVVGKHLMATGVVATLMTLCTFLMVSGGAAQDNDSSNDATLTVGQCIENRLDVSLEPLEETLVREGIIREGLLQTKVTKPMCADMLERTSSDAPVQTLVAARNYVQEIELIEGAMQKAADEASTKETGRHLSGDDALDLTLAAAQATGEATEQEATPPADGSATPTSNPTASPTSSATASPSPSPGDGDGSNGDGGGDDGGGDDGGGDDGGLTTDDGAGVEPKEKQAAAISSMLQGDSAASIEEQLDAGTEAGVRAGASRPEAAAGTRCSLEVKFLDDYAETLLPGAYKLTPTAIPEEMRYGSTRRVVLSILPTTREVFEEIKQKQEAVAKASESDVECVGLTGRMKATLGSLDDLEISSRDEDVKPVYADQTTVWEWSVTGKPKGRQSLYLDLSYAITPPGKVPVFRSHEPPLLEETVTIRATPLQNVSGVLGQDWLSLTELVIALVTSIIAPGTLLLWRKRRKQRLSGPEDQN